MKIDFEPSIDSELVHIERRKDVNKSRKKQLREALRQRVLYAIGKALHEAAAAGRCGERALWARGELEEWLHKKGDLYTKARLHAHALAIMLRACKFVSREIEVDGTAMRAIAALLQHQTQVTCHIRCFDINRLNVHEKDVLAAHFGTTPQQLTRFSPMLEELGVYCRRREDTCSECCMFCPQRSWHPVEGPGLGFCCLCDRCTLTHLDECEVGHRDETAWQSDGEWRRHMNVMANQPQTIEDFFDLLAEKPPKPAADESVEQRRTRLLGMFRRVQARIFAETSPWSSTGWPQPLIDPRKPSPPANLQVPLYPTMSRFANERRWGMQMHLVRRGDVTLCDVTQFLALPTSITPAVVETALKFEPRFGLFDEMDNMQADALRYPVNWDGTASEFPFILSWFLNPCVKEEEPNRKDELSASV